MSKKISAVLIAAAVMMSFSACQSSEDTEEAVVSVNETATEEPSDLVSEDTSAEDTSESADETGENTDDTADTAAESETDNSASEESETSSEGVTPAEIAEKIAADTAMSSIAEVGSDRIGNYIDYDMENVESFSMYICGSGAFADEVGVFELKDESSADSLIEVLEARKETKYNDFKDYVPDECDKIENAVIKNTGKYVLFAVTPDNDLAENIFDENVS